MWMCVPIPSPFTGKRVSHSHGPGLENTYGLLYSLLFTLKGVPHSHGPGLENHT